MKNDEFGDRMKLYESIQTGVILVPQLPIMARIDGRCFSTWTKGLNRPYDERLSTVMINVATRLAWEFNCNCAYTQSDEITLTWWSEDYKTQPLFGGKIFKLCSVISSATTAFFANEIKVELPDKEIPTFDCRVWNVPNLDEGANVFLWREKDATKNSISMACRHYYSNSEMQGKDRSIQQEMLFQKGVNWNDYPTFFKRGTFVQRTQERVGGLYDVFFRNMNEVPPFSTVVNRVGYIYNGESPRIEHANGNLQSCKTDLGRETTFSTK